MISNEFLQSDLFNWGILPILIFLSRLVDVSLGTLRHMFVSKGFRKIVPILGFFEVLLWLVAISQVMKNLNNAACYIAWAGGFSMGTYLGMRIEEKLALGFQVIRIITNRDSSELIKSLGDANLGVTQIDGMGAKGPVKVIFTIVKRKDIPIAVKLINIHNPNAFYSLEDVRGSSQGVFPGDMQSGGFFTPIRKLFPLRKGK